jgi:DNA-binding NarL/FixJ family response regulator
MKPWERLLTLVRRKSGPLPDSFGLDEPLRAALAERARRDQRPIEQVEQELLRAGLAQLENSDGLKRCWERLSEREQQVTALTCLGYTNRQMAAYMQLSPATVKGYVHQSLVKWRAHGKAELRLLLVQWDFSDWGMPALREGERPG